MCGLLRRDNCRPGPPDRSKRAGIDRATQPCANPPWASRGPPLRPITTQSKQPRNQEVSIERSWACCRWLRYWCLRNKRPSEPYQFLRFGAMDVTQSNKFKRFGDIHGSKPYKSTGFRSAFISQTPVGTKNQSCANPSSLSAAPLPKPISSGRLLPPRRVGTVHSPKY